MRIAIFTETFAPRVNGVVTRLRQTLPHLARRGDSVLVVAPADSPGFCDGAEVTGVRSLPLPLLDGRNGLLFEPGRPEAAATAVRRLLGDPVLRALVQSNGRRHAEDWGWGAAAQDLRNHYLAVLAVASTGTAA